MKFLLKLQLNSLRRDKIDILHTIGGDDTNTTACDLSNFLKKSLQINSNWATKNY